MNGMKTAVDLIMFDLDGTLLPHGGVIAERTIDAIRAARAKGVIATISSGRNVPSIIEYAHQIGLDGPLIGMQGAIAREIPAKGEPGNDTWAGDSWMHGGASVWVTGTYDPETNLTFWGTGNPGPWTGDTRPGDNLYTNSVVALDPDTGRLFNELSWEDGPRPERCSPTTPGCSEPRAAASRPRAPGSGRADSRARSRPAWPAGPRRRAPAG